jgi:hypothetical protein
VIQGPVATSGPCLQLVINFVSEVLHLTTISICLQVTKTTLEEEKHTAPPEKRAARLKEPQSG